MSGVLLVDYCNVFDMVDHNLLWLKLEKDAYIPSQDSTQDSMIFAFPPFSRPASPMTIKRRVFVAIMEGKLELGLGEGFGLGLGLVVGLGGYEVG